MLTKKQLLKICLPYNILGQVLCFLLVYYFVNDYFEKYVAYCTLGIVVSFVIIKFLVTPAIPWAVEKAMLFPPATRWYLVFLLPGLTVLSLLMKANGYHLSFEYGLCIQIGSLLAKYSLILASEKKRN